MRGNSHARCGAGEKVEMISKPYLLLSYSNMVGKPYEDVTSAERATGKVLNFGTTYGLEDPALAMALYGDDSAFAQKKAAQARKEYFDGIPFIRDYFESVRDQAEKDGYAETLFKRRRYIQEFQGDMSRISSFRRGSGRRKAGNLPVQGTAADIMKMAMIRVHKAFKNHGWDENMARLVLNVHDEIVVQVHKSINMWYVVKVMREAMEMDLSKHGIPPLFIGANLGYTWADGCDELEAPVYLMDEKIAWVDQLLAEGKELPVTDDPRTEWIEDINTFKLKVIEEELKKGYLDKDTKELRPIRNYLDAMKNPRLMKYSHHFGKDAAKVVMEVKEYGYLDVAKRITVDEKHKATLGEYSPDLYKTFLTDIEQEIKEKNIEDFEDVGSSRKILGSMHYFGDYKWNVVSMVKLDGAEKVAENLWEVLGSNNIEPVKYEVREKVVGEDITEDISTVRDYVKKELVGLNKQTNTIVVKMEHDDMEFLNILEGMLVPITSLREFKDDEKHVNMLVVGERGVEYPMNGYVFFRKMMPILGDMLVRHVIGRDYKGVQNQIEEVGAQLVSA